MKKVNSHHIILIAYALFVAIATLCKPQFLASNTFLNQFVGADMLSLLAVILAITFASVANIHLAINQIVARVYHSRLRDGQAAASETRSEINSNAWLLFYAFIICAVAIFIRSFDKDNFVLNSAMNGLAIGMLLVNVLVFRDIYRTVFILVSSDIAVGGAQPPRFSADEPGATNEH